MSYEDLVAALERLDDAIQRVDEAELQEMLLATVEGYKPAGATPAPGAKEEWQPISRTLH
jgi:hypothetical protein